MSIVRSHDPAAFPESTFRTQAANQEASRASDWCGTVIAIQANFYLVKLAQPWIQPHAATPVLASRTSHAFMGKGPTLRCTCRMRLKKMGQTIVVGDQVRVVEADLQQFSGAIAERFPRTAWLQRPAIANVEQVVLIFALEQPSPDPWQLSRFLVQAETTGLAVRVCFNKTDLGDRPLQDHWQTRLQNWHYTPLFTSAFAGEGLDGLRAMLRDKISVLAGPSGVGKSSLINRLIPQVHQPIAKISGKLKRGRHTTRHVELFELSDGGFIADSPGFNVTELTCDPRELIQYFPEIQDKCVQMTCQYHNCFHRDEPHCSIRGHWERYEHYLKFLAEVTAQQSARQRQPNREARWKVKSKPAGQRQYEPKLTTKIHRRSSRRQQQQQLQDLYKRQILSGGDE